MEICPNRGCRRCFNFVRDFDDAFHSDSCHYYCFVLFDEDGPECIDGYSYETGDCPSFILAL